jgi:hypothetical protein
MLTTQTYEGKTAVEWRESAAANRKEKNDSFERCDTDGFLSQWASGICGRRDEYAAQLAEQGGVSDFPVLLDSGGNVVAIDYTPAGYSASAGYYVKSAWKVLRKYRKCLCRGFIPMGEKSRIQKKLGLREGRAILPAKADVVGTGHGLSGTAWAAIVIDNGQFYTLLEEGHHFKLALDHEEA